MLTFSLPLGTNDYQTRSISATNGSLCATRSPINVARVEITGLPCHEDIRDFVGGLREDFAADCAIVFEHRNRVDEELETNLVAAGFVPEAQLNTTATEDVRSMIYLAPAADAVQRRLRRTDHVSIRVASMENTIKFYSLLGFSVTRKFLTSGVRAAWLASEHFMIEAIEMPAEDAQPPHDLWNDTFRRGLYHISLDVTLCCSSIAKYLGRVEARSKALFRRRLRILDGPRQRMLFDLIVETAFIADPDGTVIELLRSTGTVDGLEADW